MYVAIILTLSIVASVFLQLGLIRLCKTMHEDMMSRHIDRLEAKHGKPDSIHKHFIIFMECEKYSHAVKSVLGKGLLIALLLNIFLLVVLTVVLISRS